MKSACLPNAAQPVYFRIFDGIRRKEVVRHKCNASARNSVGIFPWEDLFLSLLYVFRPILDYELEVWVYG